MASVIHIAEIAAILAVAYMLGWVIGFVAHRLFAPRPLAQPSIPEARLAVATGAAEALVKAPVIVPVADPAAAAPAATSVGDAPALDTDPPAADAAAPAAADPAATTPATDAPAAPAN